MLPGFRRASDLFMTESRPAVIIGSGPSLNKFDPSELDDESFLTIALNDQPFLAGDCYIPDFWFFNDRGFFTRRGSNSVPQSMRVIANSRSIRAHLMYHDERPVWWNQMWGFDTRQHDPVNGLFHAGTTAVSAVDFARRLGCPCVALLGMDCTKTYAKIHPRYKVGVKEEVFPSFVNAWQTLGQHYQKASIAYDIVNCSPTTQDVHNRKEAWESWKLRQT